MNEDEIRMQLNALAELQCQQDALRIDKQKLLDSVLTPEIRQQMAEIEMECRPQEETIKEAIDDATEAVKMSVLKFGQSVKGERLHAVWMQGRHKWDTRALSGYMVEHPELGRFYSMGDPSITIRKV